MKGDALSMQYGVNEGVALRDVEQLCSAVKKHYEERISKFGTVSYYEFDPTCNDPIYIDATNLAHSRNAITEKISVNFLNDELLLNNKWNNDSPQFRVIALVMSIHFLNRAGQGELVAYYAIQDREYSLDDRDNRSPVAKVTTHHYRLMIQIDCLDSFIYNHSMRAYPSHMIDGSIVNDDLMLRELLRGE